MVVTIFSTRSLQMPHFLWIASLALVLTACGGGGSTPSPPGGASTVTATPQTSAVVLTPTNQTLSWNIGTPLALILKNAAGQVIPASQVTCSAANGGSLTVSSDCSTITGNRLGAQIIVAQGGGVTANATINVIPQQQAIGTAGITSSNGSGDYNLVVTPDQRVFAWGANVTPGVLGLGLTSQQLPSSSLPLQVLAASGAGPLSEIMAVSAGKQTALALTKTGTVYSWGANGGGQLGRNGVANGSSLPGLVVNPSNNGSLQNIVQISMGDNNASALADDGTAYTWGHFAGQNLSNDYSPYPAQVKTSTSVLTNVVQISAGGGFSLALTSNGQVYACGFTNSSIGGPIPSTQNSSGDQLFAVPITISGSGQALGNIVAISAGYFVSLALDAHGNVWAWGSNDQGELGQNNNLPYTGAVKVLAPNSAGYLSNIKMIAAGGIHGLAMDSSSNVWSWGYSQNGQLGDGANHPRVNNSPLPAAVVQTSGTGQLTGVSAIAAGYSHSLGLMPDGTLQIWGSGFAGNLGQGGTGISDMYVPTPVKNALGNGNLSLTPLSSYPNPHNIGIF